MGSRNIHVAVPGLSVPVCGALLGDRHYGVLPLAVSDDEGSNPRLPRSSLGAGAGSCAGTVRCLTGPAALHPLYRRRLCRHCAPQFTARRVVRRLLADAADEADFLAELRADPDYPF